ncbi:MAG: hypothetical protein QOG03_1190 [Actinomycetota bacterium]|nr:hypothetical protein [Actinomycetota bacterium]
MATRLGRGTSGGELPSGSVTFLFTDIEGSTRLMQRAGDAYEPLLIEHRGIIAEAIAAHRGHLLGTEGDGCIAVFAGAADAVATCVTAQRALSAIAWPEGLDLTVRMGLHTGDAVPNTEGDYISLTVNQAARVGAAGHGGQVLLSSSTAAVVRGALPPELGLDLERLGSFRLKDFPDAEVIHQLLIPGLPSDFPPLRLLGARIDLPVFRTSFVGREDELDALGDRIRQPGLVTVTGPGGVGKTRLAVELATMHGAAFADGARFIDLTRVTDDHEVGDAVATAMGVREAGPDGVEATVQALADRHVLLVLDNCEHVLGGAAALADAILDRCRQTHVLATSREPLAVEGEQVWPLGPLQLPDATGESLEELLDLDTVRLFGERARAVDPTFRLDGASCGAVADICRRLDGLPLAIELAAASVRLMAPGELAARLADGLPVPGKAGRLAPARQRTLRGVFEWSDQLLSPPERMLLRRLAVFRGSWSADAAEEVCAGGALEGVAIVDTMSSLVEKSLVVAITEGGRSRFRMLETIRTFSAERLAAAGEDDAVHQAHAQWMATLMSGLSADLIGPESLRAGAQIDDEVANLRAALAWSAKGAPPIFVQLCRDTGRYWLQRGILAEGREQIERALAVAEPGSARGDLAAAGSRLALSQADYDGALQFAELAQAEAVAAGDAGVLARSLQTQAEVALRLGQSAESRALFEKSLPLAMASDQVQLEVVALQGLGAVETAENQLDAARRSLTQALERSRHIGDDPSTATVLGFLGENALHQGEIDEAAALFEEELAMARAARHPHLIGYALGDITNVLVMRRTDFDRCEELLEEALALAEGIGDRQGVIRARLALGQVARLGPRDFALAEEHLLAALATARSLGIVPSVHETLFQLGLLAWDKGDKELCEHRMRESVTVLRGADVAARAVVPLVVIAELELDKGDALFAARLLGAASGVSGSEGEAGDEGAEIGAKAREVLGDAAYESEWAEGRDLPFPAVVDLLG